MPKTDIVQQVDTEHGSHFTMKKRLDDGRLFACARPDQKIRAFVSNCGITRTVDRQARGRVSGSEVTIKRPEVVDEYENHRSMCVLFSELMSIL